MRYIQLRAPTHHLLIQCLRAPFRLAFAVLAAAWIVPQMVVALKGTAVKSSSRSKVVIAIMVLVGVLALIVMLFAHRQTSEFESGGTIPAAAPKQLEAWAPPSTTDPREFAIAYARAIWTYDTTRHSYVDWQNAVSVFADPTSAAPQVARSLLPQWAEWDQLQSHEARGVITAVTAEVTPELEAMVNRSDVPEGWHAYVVQGKQTVVSDLGTRFLDRQAAVAVVCTPTCRFWSATTQVSP